MDSAISQKEIRDITDQIIKKYRIDNLIKKRVGADFLIYRPEEIEKRIQMGDPFIKTIFKEGKVLYC